MSTDAKTQPKNDFGKLKSQLRKKYTKLEDSDFISFENEKEWGTKQDDKLLEMLQKKTGQTIEVLRRDLHDISKTN
ncbi:MAG: hypothetical protein K2X01_00325 [Cyanobacteria bacterium]|nr:hypothetical protein [Cyanobacteriota bacterium]